MVGITLRVMMMEGTSVDRADSGFFITRSVMPTINHGRSVDSFSFGCGRACQAATSACNNSIARVN